MTVLRNLDKDSSLSGVQASLPFGRRQSSDRVEVRAPSLGSYRRLTWSGAAGVILFSLILGLATGVGAHAILLGSDPVHGAILDESPRTALFRFNAALEQAVTRVYLVDVHQVRTPLRPIDSSIDRLVVGLPRLSPGVYTIAYKVLARDGHVTEGFIRFTIRGR